jgi:hypothetical protein
VTRQWKSQSVGSINDGQWNEDEVSLRLCVEASLSKNNTKGGHSFSSESSVRKRLRNNSTASDYDSNSFDELHDVMDLTPRGLSEEEEDNINANSNDNNDRDGDTEIIDDDILWEDAGYTFDEYGLPVPIPTRG